MGLVIYLFVAVGAVLAAGWALYVLPTPGPLSPMALSVALLPVAVIMGALVVGLVAVWLLLHLLRRVLRLVGRR